MLILAKQEEAIWSHYLNQFSHFRFVEFESDDAVNKAVEMFNEEEFNGSKLRVMVVQQQQQRQPQLEQSMNSKPWSNNDRGMSNGPINRIPR